MAPLYNTLRPAGNGCLFFLLIVFTFKFGWRWKKGVELWIPGLVCDGALFAEFLPLAEGRAEELRVGSSWGLGSGGKEE